MSEICPDGWVPGPINNCYKFVLTPKADYKGAQALCRDMGGELATLDSLNEILWMRGYRSFHPAVGDRSYVGAHRSSVDKK